MICDGLNRSIGSYLEVDNLKYDLINASIEFLEREPGCTNELIIYLKDFISIDGINYQNYSIELTNKIKLYGLNGIVCFIMKNEFDNIMSVGESMDFIFSLDIIKDSLNMKYFTNNYKKIENFYLFQILMKSIKNFKIIEFY